MPREESEIDAKNLEITELRAELQVQRAEANAALEACQRAKSEAEKQRANAQLCASVRTCDGEDILI